VFSGVEILVDGVSVKKKEELGRETKVIGTGGYAELIGRETQMIDHVNPQLTLEGLRMIHELNKS